MIQFSFTIVLIMIRIFGYDEETIQRMDNDSFYNKIGQMKWYENVAAVFPQGAAMISMIFLIVCGRKYHCTNVYTGTGDAKREIRNFVTIYHIQDQFCTIAHFTLFYTIMLLYKKVTGGRLSGHILFITLTSTVYIRNYVLNSYFKDIFDRNGYKKIALAFKLYCLIDLIGLIYLYYVCIFTVLIFHTPIQSFLTTIIVSSVALLITKRIIRVPFYETFVAYLISKLVGCDTDAESQHQELELVA